MASGLAAATSAQAASARAAEFETRVARRDFRGLAKEDIPTPAMLVDLDLFEKNLQKLADHCRKAKLDLRPHVKVHKSPEIARRQVALGAIGLTAATIAECELMAAAGLKSILLTRQAAGKNAIARVVALAKKEPTFGTVVDDLLAAEWL